MWEGSGVFYRSINISADQAAIAGRPAPTGDWVHLQNQVGCQAAFASKLAPTED
jgi:hypothetical protein